jgi:hypothetical protein
MQFVGNILDKVPNLSVITAIEALCWKIADKNKEDILQAFVKEANILYIIHDIARPACCYWLSGKIKLPNDYDGCNSYCSPYDTANKRS